MGIEQPLFRQPLLQQPKVRVSEVRILPEQRQGHSQKFVLGVQKFLGVDKTVE